MGLPSSPLRADHRGVWLKTSYLLELHCAVDLEKTLTSAVPVMHSFEQAESSQQFCLGIRELSPMTRVTAANS